MPVLNTSAEYSAGALRLPQALPNPARTDLSKIEQNRTKSNKAEGNNLKKPEKTEGSKRTIFNVLLNFALCSSTTKKFPENLKPLDPSPPTDHAIPPDA